MATPATSDGINPSAHGEAERWLVRLLDADTHDPRRAEFERWLTDDPVHASAYRKAEQLWELGLEAARHPDLRAEANRAMHFTRSDPIRSLRIWLVPAMTVAVAVFFLGGMVALWWPAFGAGQQSIRYATRTGQQRAIQLQDGSALLLDTDSVAVVRYGSRARSVTLLHGRAEFRVRHDGHWPFIVSAGGGTVTDVGTTFQVSIGTHRGVGVILLEGKVSVATAHSKSTLTTGEALRFDHAGVVHAPHPADLEAALGWTSGEIVAHDWPLPRLLDELNRYSQAKIVLGNPGLQDVRVTGTFRAGDQATFLKILEYGWPIHARRLSSTRIELVHK